MNDGGKVIWRVSALDGLPHASAFDALILPTDGGSLDRLGRPTRVIDAAVPHQAELADTPFVLVVHARADIGPLKVECEAFGADGSRQVYGRSSPPIAVIVRSTTGVLGTGLPDGLEPGAQAT
jgi:hypothetical protein